MVMRNLLGLLIALLLVGCGASSGGPGVAWNEGIMVGKVISGSESIDYSDPTFKPNAPFVNSGHSYGIASLSITADDKYLETGGFDGTIRLWNLKDLQEIKSIQHGLDGYIKSDITPDGKYTGIFSPISNKVIIFDIKTSKKINEIELSKTGNPAFLIVPRKKQFIVSSVRAIDIYDFEGNKEASINGISAQVLSNTSEDGRYIASSSFFASRFNSKIFLHSLITKRPIRAFEISSVTKGSSGEFVTSLILSKDAKFLYVATNSGYITKIDTDRGRIVKHFTGCDGVYGFALSHDGQYLLAGDKKGILKIWDTSSGKNLQTLQFNGHTIYGIKALHHSSNAIVAIENDLALINYETGKIVKKFNSHNKWLGVATSEDNQKIFSVNYDNSIHYSSLKNNKIDELFSKKGFKKLFEHIALSADGTLGATVSKKALTLWYLTKKEKKDLTENSIIYTVLSRINALSISPDGKILANGYVDKGNYIELTNLETNKKRHIGLDIGDGYSFFLKKSALSDKSTGLNLTGEKERYVAVAGIGLKGTTRENYIIVFNYNNGKLIEKLKDEKLGLVQAVTFSRNGNFIVSASSDGHLRVWERKTGNLIAKIGGTTANIRSMHFSNDNTYIVSMGLDGALRYWDIHQKKELLAKYVFEDGEWITITPEGYFDASTNGAKHLSVQTGPMEVASIDQYFEQFYRPDIIAAISSDLDNGTYYTKSIEMPKLKLSDIKPAPEVKIVNTKTNISQEDLQVTLKIIPKEKSGYGQIRLYIDDTLVKTDNDRALKLKKNAIYKTYTLKLTKGKHTIKASVFNKDNTMQSKYALLTVTSSYETVVKQNLYAVIIGINKYKNPAISLKYAVDDAKLFADTLKKRADGLFGKIDIQLLTTQNETTKTSIIKSLRTLHDLKPNDMFVFYVASHGMVEDAKYHMITSNVGALSSRKIKQEALSQEELKELIANVPTSKKFIVLDTCNSGALGKSLEVALLTRGLTEVSAMKVLSRAVGSTIISASSSTQEALEGYEGHGLLTYVLADGLNGKADSDKDGYVKTLEISNYVEDTVPEIAEKVFQRAQYPYVSPLGQGFPLVKVNY